MSTVYVDHREADVDLDGDRLVIRAAGERKATVPLRLVERVVVASSARLTTRLISRLRTLGVGLVIAGPQFGSGPISVVPTAADSLLRLAQYEVTRDVGARLAIARPLVARKVERALAVLDALLSGKRGDRRLIVEAQRRLGGITARLDGGDTIDRIGVLMGLEGAAAHAYFAAYASAFAPALGFAARNRRPPRDPVNVCLSIGYTLLHSEALQAAARAGLDPALGIYHETRPGRDSLACDLVEPVRCEIDLFVHGLFAAGGLRVESFSGGGDAPCKLGKAGRLVFYRSYEETSAVSVRERLTAEATIMALAIGRHGTPPANATRLRAGAPLAADAMPE
jgi:CRISPR-associated protein Cas1